MYVPGSISVHDETHDGLEVVTVESDLALLGHVHPASVPGPATTPHSLHSLAAVGRLEGVHTVGETGEDVCGYDLQQGRIGRPYLSPGVTQSNQALGNTPARGYIYTHTHSGKPSIMRTP